MSVSVSVSVESAVKELIARGRFFYAGKEYAQALQSYEQALEQLASVGISSGVRVQELCCQCGRAVQWQWMMAPSALLLKEVERYYGKALAIEPHGYNYCEALINLAFLHFQQRQEAKSGWEAKSLRYARRFYDAYLAYPEAYATTSAGHITIYGNEHADLVWAFGVIVDIFYHAQMASGLSEPMRQWCLRPATIATIRMVLAHHPLKKMYLEMFEDLLSDLM